MAGSKDNNNISLKLKCEYDIRFRGLERYRNAVWGIVCKNIFSKYIKENANVLDLGAGYGEFINNIKADQKIAMDINDDCRSRLEPNVHFIHQDCSETWQLDNQKLDIVFSSNLMEHLKSKEKVESLLSEAYRCLKNGGKIILIGPNIKYTGGAYWDFWDHLLPLTENRYQNCL